ncbi:MAG: CapA family protein [Chloroflexi bacterium]|nr:CapA family protein [Chloroflexota bacterium]
MARGNELVSLYAVADVGAGWNFVKEPRSLFANVEDPIKQADIAFCQMEGIWSKKGAPQVHGFGAHIVTGHPEYASILADVGFDVASVASNHSLDWGPDAFLDTIDILRRTGVATCGGGKDLADARRPAILERKGVKVAFLAYCSILLPGFWAEANRPGAAPMRASTYYEPYEYQAGTPVKIITIPNQQDLDALQEDVRKAKKEADVVVVSLHWGLHFVPRTIAMYQPVVGHAAIDAGADLILGHHAHILKGIEVYKGKVIFYSLCNFAMVIPSSRRIGPEASPTREIYKFPVDPDYPLYDFHPEARMTIAASCKLSKDGVEEVSYQPVWINGQAVPRILKNSDPAFAQVVNYVEDITKDYFDTKFRVAGDEVVVVTK